MLYMFPVDIPFKILTKNGLVESKNANVTFTSINPNPSKKKKRIKCRLVLHHLHIQLKFEEFQIEKAKDWNKILFY